MHMIKEEIWGVSIGRIRSFFQSQQDVFSVSPDEYVFRSCRIRLTELAPACTGMWRAARTRLHLEGEAADVQSIYHRFFLQFLSAGG